METYLSDYVGRPVVYFDGKYAGYVTGTKLSKKLDAVRALVCADGEEEEFILPAAAIRGFGDEGVTIGNKAGKLHKEMRDAPIGTPVLTDKGVFAGLVRDFVREGDKLTHVELSSGERYPLGKIRGFGEFFILNLSVQKPASKKGARETENAQTETAREVAASAFEGAPLAKKTAPVRAGSNLLTGKRVPRDIADVRGNVIIRKGSVITPEILKSAVFHNKLFELTVTVLSPD